MRYSVLICASVVDILLSLVFKDGNSSSFFFWWGNYMIFKGGPSPPFRIVSSSCLALAKLYVGVMESNRIIGWLIEVAHPKERSVRIAADDKILLLCELRTWLTSYKSNWTIFSSWLDLQFSFCPPLGFSSRIFHAQLSIHLQYACFWREYTFRNESSNRYRRDKLDLNGIHCCFCF
jgi:hypothetical protein